MSEKQSEWAKQVTGMIKAVDKLLRNIVKDTAEVIHAWQELRELGRKIQDKGEDEASKD